jgi:hypothetical protein
MWLLIAEAFIALALLVFIVWWTMSGRRRVGDTAADRAVAADPASPADPSEVAVATAAQASVADDAGAQAPGRDPR